jgi:hypothetical protein
MWPTLLTQWLTPSGKVPKRGGKRRRPPFCRPLLESLEDRSVPASLSWSTYFHGTVLATAVDSAGNLYVTGQSDASLPTTPGAFETSGAGAFAAKFTSTGALVYATYLGNSGSNWYLNSGTGIAVDAAGDAYVIGTNANVPTTANAIASSGGADFVAELNPSGSGLLYATYLPGTVNGSYRLFGGQAAIAVDGSGNIYVAGAAQAGFPVTAGAFQTAYLDGNNSNNNTAGNAFFAKINPALSGTASLLYATYLGGSGGDAATALAVDSAGNAYLEGYTGSSNFPTTSGAFQRTLGGFGPASVGDTFVAKFNPGLSGAASLVYSTYLGGNGDDGYFGDQTAGDIYSFVGLQIDGGIAVDSAGNAYVTSATTSTNFPTTPGAYQTTSNIYNSGGLPGSDVFVTKLNATGSALVYSTYLGGGKAKGKNPATFSGGASIAVDASGDAHVTGWTDSTHFPTVNALQTTNGGGYDAFVTVLNPSGSGLLFSSYFGGSGNDYGYGIALDSAGNAYVGVQTSSSNFPTTAGAFQTTPGNGFNLKIDPPADVSEVSIPLSASGVNHALPARYLQPMTAGSSPTLTGDDAYGNVATGYRGTVHFTSTDKSATLPANYTFTAADNGAHTFSSGVKFKTTGKQTLTAADTVTGTITGSVTVQVNAPAAPPAPAGATSEPVAPPAPPPVPQDAVVAGTPGPEDTRPDQGGVRGGDPDSGEAADLFGSLLGLWVRSGLPL